MIERRTLGVEIRVDGETPKIVGHAAVFNRETQILWFREKIAPGAFKDALPTADVRALINHDPNLLLGRTPKTLRAKEDDVGLAVEIDPPDTQYAKDLLTVMRRGDITQMSFAFETVADEWDRSDPSMPLRILRKLNIFDVSVVTFPAYEQTDVTVASRSWDAYKKANPEPKPVRSRIMAARGRI